MVTGKIVNYDPTNKSFSSLLETAHRLTIQDNVYDFFASMQWISTLAQVEDDILNAFI